MLRQFTRFTRFEQWANDTPFEEPRDVIPAIADLKDLKKDIDRHRLTIFQKVHLNAVRPGSFAISKGADSPADFPATDRCIESPEHPAMVFARIPPAVVSMMVNQLPKSMMVPRRRGNRVERIPRSRVPGGGQERIR